MSHKKKDECCTVKNATVNVDVLTIVAPELKSRDQNAIASNVCQDVMTSTNISSKSIMGIVATRLLLYRSKRCLGARFYKLCKISLYRLSG